MITKLFCVAFVIVTASAWREQVELEGAKAYAVYPKTEKHFSLLNDFHLKSGGIDFVQHPRGLGGEGRVVVSKETQTAFESILRSNGISFKVYMKDVKAVAEQEIRANEARRLLSMKDSKAQFDFTAYQDHKTINAYLDTLEERFPDKVKVTDAGESFEGRIIKQVLISTSGGTDASKPVIIAEAGMHAREWIAPAQAMYMIHKLLEDTQGVDPNIINNIDWVIIPLLNPDGYEYTETNRMWRKTRSTSTSSICPGIDGNRNFGYQWMFSGASSNPCTDTYAGPEPLSEKESKILEKVVLEYKGRAKAYMAIHSSGSWIIYPYAYNAQPTPDNAIIHLVADSMSKAINAYITSTGSDSKPYQAGNAGTAFYRAAGSSKDWTYAVGNIKLSYTLELQAGSPNGFDLPPEKILDVVKETWEGMVVLAKHVNDENKP